MTSSEICQSCAMPLAKPSDHGTETDGSQSSDYCTHCYQGGSFTQPDVTMDEMIDVVAGVMGMPAEQARPGAREALSGLKGWHDKIARTYVIKTETSIEMPYCCRCGNDVSEGIAYCPNCGARQGGSEPKPQG